MVSSILMRLLMEQEVSCSSDDVTLIREDEGGNGGGDSDGDDTNDTDGDTENDEGQQRVEVESHYVCPRFVPLSS